jgi:RNA polymerase sigma-54 factor
MMELPLIDLREKIEEEVERNPALEVLEDKSTVSLDDAYKPQKEEDAYFETTSDPGFINRSGNEASDEKQKFIEGVLTKPETLQEHLLWQVWLEPVDNELRQICEILIQNLDDDGFHKEPPESLFSNTKAFPTLRSSPERLDRALSLVRTLEPQGCCTQGYLESLRVQLKFLPDVPEGAEAALSYLELLERGKFTEAARKMGCTEADVHIYFELIKELSPFPGRQFSFGETRFVAPDIQVIKKEGEFVIILNDEEIPVLGINPFFQKISQEKKGEKQAREFVKENIREARSFIQSIHQRNDTLLKVSRAIVEFQRSFFANGPKYLAPLTLRDIAQEVGVHETTVSRTANGKYMQTEWGIFELRHFFTNSISGLGSGGSQYSKEGVKEIIRELISIEDRHFSDQEIAGILAKRGIPLARRTVAKYRKELDLGSSYTR